MSTWTVDALQALEGYLERNRGRVACNGADADEVLADLRRHVEEEVAALKLPVVTGQDVQQIVTRIGPLPAEDRPEHEPAKPPRSSFASRVRDSGGAVAILLFGVILPLIAVGFELVTRLCAGTFFDPLPTTLHILLVGTVPLANALAWVAVNQGNSSVRRSVWLANGFAFGVSLFYSVLFLPMSPFAAVGIIYFGLGLLPLTPLFAFVSAWRLRALLRRRWIAQATHFEMGSAAVSATEDGLWIESPTNRVSGNGSSTVRASFTGVDAEDGLRDACVRSPMLRGWGWSALLPVGLLVLLALPGLLTRYWLERAGSDSPEQSTRAIQWLRKVGSVDVLLMECYGRGDRLWIEVFGGRRPNPELARKVFYRVTGKPFNAFAPPLSKYQRAGRDLFDEYDWDAGLGGDAVAGQVKGLSLVASRLDGLCKPDEAWAYVEWILEFENSHPSRQREARAQIQLPPGGVVSRVTLWVNGEEREAAFAGKSQVREAYQTVAVQQGRDPVLVTTSGPNRVLVQCFPIPPRGGRMKVRLGVTTPLIIESKSEAALKLPCFLERNFAVSESGRHLLWLEAPQAVRGASQRLVVDTSKPDKHGLRGEFTDADLSSAEAIVRFSLSEKVQLARAQDRKSEGGAVIRQTLETPKVEMPSRVAIVLDGSEDMTASFPKIAGALDGVPLQPELAVWLVQDGVSQLFNSAWRSSEPISAVVARLHGFGGQDDLPALLQAWEWAAAKRGGVVLWIHGPQPLLLNSLEALKQRLEWRSDENGPTLIDVPAKPGPNRVAESLSNIDAFTSLTRLGDLKDDLEVLFAKWSGRRAEFRLVRELQSPPAFAGGEPTATGSSHIVRLWALDRIRILTKARKFSDAVKQAAIYQLVTSVSGAVVLEKAQQFREANLTPVEPASVPTVPEPRTWVLLLVGFWLLLLWRRRPSPALTTTGLPDSAGHFRTNCSGKVGNR